MITLDEAREILAKEYHIDNFTYLVKDLLLPDFIGDKHSVEFNNSIFTSVKQLGDSAACNLSVFEVVLKDGAQNRRVAITQEMFKILRGLRINNAVVAFANADKHNFRISLLTSKYEYDGEKIVKVLSNPRRYSYSLGIGTKTKTAYKFLIAKGKVANLDELINRFSVEVVNKQFYSEIATSFTELVGGERDGKTYEKLLNLHGTVDHNKYAEFGVRLIGRIMFCWFLREKRSENNIPLVPDDMLALETISGKANYYHDVLEPLFFELLNTPHKKRKDCFDTEYYKLIPYLNGGLFSPHTDDRYKFDPANNCGQYGVVTIPNEWFIKLYQTLGQYNFTVDENTAYDIELSIDPEMLGRIFENLLAEINPETGENAKKSTGSFYTPRDIVDYMVDSSLCEYLKTKTGIDEIKLNALISYSKDDDDLAVFDAAEKKKLIDALYTVTVLDPACGSGAFPIGMLQKVVYVLQEIDPDANLWFDKATENVGILLKKEFEKKFNAGSLNYIRKLSVIQNSIFGIDIQPIAVEISRLRCFLSLIIEEKVDDAEENRGINPLPNLDFKFIIANSLIQLPDESIENMGNKYDQTSMFENVDHITQLKQIREEYFNADNERRLELREEFVEVQKSMLQQTLSMSKMATERYTALFNWAPFKNESTSWFDPEWMFGIKDGFDIVIGNPPYLAYKKINLDEKKKYNKLYGCAKGQYDLYGLFIEKGYALLKKGGMLTYITSSTYFNNKDFIELRKHLLSHTLISYIVNLDETIFETAQLDVAIIGFKKCSIHELEGHLIKIFNDKKSFIAGHYEERRQLDFYKSNTSYEIKIKCDSFDEQLIEKMSQNSILLENVLDLPRGIEIGGNSSLIQYDYKDGLDKLLVGRNISRYCIDYQGAYIKYDHNNLSCFKEYSIYKQPKILIQRIRNLSLKQRIVATIDFDNYLCTNTLRIGNLINYNYDLFYVLGILNSRLINWMFLKYFLNKDIYSYQLKQIPIKILGGKEQEPLVQKVKKIIQAAQDNNADQYNAIDEEINQYIYKIYSLTPDEIALVEESVK